jgi:GDP-D-mannose dehydratase
MKRALITVITGQDGSLLTELLMRRGHEVNRISWLRRGFFSTQKSIDNEACNLGGVGAVEWPQV